MHTYICIYLNEMKQYVNTKMYAQIFTASVFIVSKK